VCIRTLAATFHLEITPARTVRPARGTFFNPSPRDGAARFSRVTTSPWLTPWTFLCEESTSLTRLFDISQARATFTIDAQRNSRLISPITRAGGNRGQHRWSEEMISEPIVDNPRIPVASMRAIKIARLTRKRQNFIINKSAASTALHARLDDLMSCSPSFSLWLRVNAASRDDHSRSRARETEVKGRKSRRMESRYCVSIAMQRRRCELRDRSEDYIW